MKAVIYARYSSDKQTEQSIEGQLRVCNDYAQRNGYEIIENYIDRAMTGRNDQRESFQKMIKDSEKRKFEAVIVYKLDRFSRDRYDSAVNKKQLKKNGVRVVSATENISTEPEGILLESLLEGLAEYYSAELAQKVKRGIRESVLKGHFTGGAIPYGYDIVDKKYVINQQEAKIVERIYRLFLSNKTYQNIADILNSEKITNKNGKKFQHHQLHNILTKPLYMGTLVGSGVKVEGVVPAIVTKEMFMEVQNRLDICQQHNSKGDFLLTGKIFCGKCNKNMTGTSGTGRSKVYYYYQCTNDKISIKKELIEDITCSAIRDFLNGCTQSNNMAVNIDNYLKETKSSATEKYLQDKIKKIDKEIENITNAILQGIINESLKNKNKQLLEEREHYAAELHKLQNLPLNKISGQGIALFLREIAQSKNMEDKSLLIKTMLHKVIIHEDKAVIILNTKSGHTSKSDTRAFLEVVLKDYSVRPASPSDPRNLTYVHSRSIIPHLITSKHRTMNEAR